MNDLIKYRIEGVLDEMSQIRLVELPADQPLSISDFVERTKVTGVVISSASKLGDSAEQFQGLGAWEKS